MTEDCVTCPQLYGRLASVAGGAYVLAAFIGAELDEPTMAWKELLPLIMIRVEQLAEQAQGGN